MNNIILIGMPGAGKSTIGVLLAKELGYQFVDSDLLIQQQENRLLSQIIEEQGQQIFLEIEEQVNSKLDYTNTVIATGGSVIYGPLAMEHLKKIGTVIYIKLSCEELINRLGNIKRRGVVLKPNQTLYDLYLERCPLYEKYADIILDAEGTTIEETLDKITSLIPIRC
jgi:shikimate kinase